MIFDDESLSHTEIFYKQTKVYKKDKKVLQHFLAMFFQ